MCGFCAFNYKSFACALILFFSAGMAWAQAQQGTVIHDDAMVYSDADFDAPVVTTLPRGSIYNISTGKKGPFYKIRLRPGSVAWIADNDIQVGAVKNLPDPALEKDKDKDKDKDKEKKKKKADKKKDDDEDSYDKKPKKAFDMQRFRGLDLEMLHYNEATLGGHPTDNLLFYGMKIAGPDTMFEGDTNTEANIMLHAGAPDYYKKATGNSANGWIFLTDFLFETTNPVSPSSNYFYGFGPMFKYSHFDLQLTGSGRTTSYSADDMSIGAVFNFGVAFKISKFALRLDAKYYWEKQSYYAGGLSFLFPF